MVNMREPPGRRARQRAAALALALPLLLLPLGMPPLGQQSAAPAPAPDAVGIVHGSAGEAHILRGALALAARLGQAVLRADILRTGPQGRLAVQLADGSMVAMGPAAEASLEEHKFAEGQRSGTTVLEIMRGSVRVTIGRMGSLPDKRIEIRLAGGTVHAHGGDLLVTAAAAAQDVLLLSGHVEVRNAAGHAILKRGRLATRVSSRSIAPEAPAQRSRREAQAALERIGAPARP